MGGHIPKLMFEWVISQQRQIGWRSYAKLHRKIPLFIRISEILCETGGLCRLSVERLIALSVIGLEESPGMKIYISYHTNAHTGATASWTSIA